MAATIIRPSPLALRVTLPALTVLPTLTIRERLMRAVKARLQTILAANGYETSIGQTVNEGLLIDAEPPAIPSLNFWDGNESGQIEAGQVLRSLQLTVEGYDKRLNEETPDKLTVVARNMVTDVERALWRDPETLRPDVTFGGLAVGIEFSQSQPVIGLKPHLWIGSTSLWEIIYRTRAGNPYSQNDAAEEE